ncbi:MAG: phosphomethylpyrimidine synthase ThiC [Thermodesulfovibrionales bacterium]
MTQIEYAKKGIVTKEVRAVAQDEGISPEALAQAIAEGTAVITKNIQRDIRPLGIGKGLRTKINANIGTSKDSISYEEELSKLDACIKYGADAVMDLSTGGNLREFRRLLISRSTIALGTVPIYDAVVQSVERYGTIANMTPDDIFKTIKEHGEDGVDFITVHCGVTRASIERLKNDKRILDVVSRGGSFLLEWIVYNDKENPLYEDFDRLIEIAKRYDMTLSLGDGFRPGCLADATDRSQIEELLILGELHERALAQGVQSIIEGPGHVPLNQVEMNIRIQKEICKGAPFYVLGPLVTDCAMGYDHIATAIGGAVAAMAGADFLCYVTPAEHIRLPSIEDVRDGIISAKIAAHAGDIAKGIKSAIKRDLDMAICRKNLDWEGQIRLSFDPEKVKSSRSLRPPKDNEVCSMCGELCAIKTVRRALRQT